MISPYLIPGRGNRETKMKLSLNGYVWLTKRETECLTVGFAEIAKSKLLRADHRDLLKQFAKVWFSGGDLKFHEPDQLGSRFLAMCIELNQPLQFMQRPGRKGRERPVSFHSVLAKHQSNPDRFAFGSYLDLKKFKGRIPQRVAEVREAALFEWLTHTGREKADLAPWADELTQYLIGTVESLTQEVAILKTARGAKQDGLQSAKRSFRQSYEIAYGML